MALLSFSIIGLVLLTALPSFSETRSWTNEEGKTIQARVDSFTKTHVRLIHKGTLYEMPIRTLSKKDQEHVALLKRDRPIRIQAKTLEIQSNERSRQKDARKVQVSVFDTMDRNLKIVFVWIGDDGNKSRYGKFKTIKKDISKDGSYLFEVTYPNIKKKKFDRNYRGYAVKVINEKGIVLGQDASMGPFVRFLK